MASEGEEEGREGQAVEVVGVGSSKDRGGVSVRKFVFCFVFCVGIFMKNCNGTKGKGEGEEREGESHAAKGKGKEVKGKER